MKKQTQDKQNADAIAQQKKERQERIFAKRKVH
jgi:hypothetical protein